MVSVDGFDKFENSHSADQEQWVTDWRSSVCHSLKMLWFFFQWCCSWFWWHMLSVMNFYH